MVGAVARFSLPFVVPLCLATAPAVAGEAACRFEAGVMVVPAVVAGIAGDYIFDTGSARTQIHDTRARAEGVAGDAITGDVAVADMRIAGLPVTVADLDVRTWNLPTAAAGVIGADALRGFVVDVDFRPCRIRISAPGRARAFSGRTLDLAWDRGRPTAEAAVSDDRHELTGRFVLATGSNVPVRLADDLAQAPGAARIRELYPEGVWLARLPQVRFAGGLGRDVAAGLMAPEGDVAGVLGGWVLAHFRLRFDFPADRLIVAPAP